MPESLPATLTTIDSHGVPLTDWLDGQTRPVHTGVYLRLAPAGPYTCWDGARWRADAATPSVAAAQTAMSRVPVAAWRGLSSPPDTPCLTCKGHTVVDHGVHEEHGTDLIGECPDC